MPPSMTARAGETQGERPTIVIPPSRSSAVKEIGLLPGGGDELPAGVTRLGRPAETVRGWLRRFAGRCEPVRWVFTRLLRVLDPDPVMPEPQPTGWADAVAAIRAAAAAAAARFGLGAVTWPQVAVAVSSGRLLAPGWPEEMINTS
jgi:hypothetical protein